VQDKLTALTRIARLSPAIHNGQDFKNFAGTIRPEVLSISTAVFSERGV
jgi:hypothetical protein